MKVIFNGELIEHSLTTCDDRGWLPGTGIFETIRTEKGLPWALSRHMRRVVNSAKESLIALPSEDEMRHSLHLLLGQTPYVLGLLRVSFDLDGNWCAAHLEYEEFSNPATLTIIKKPIEVSATAIKRFPYTHRMQLLQEAKSNGADDAIVINSNDKVTETAVTNLLLQIDDQWCTPPISDGVLPGVMRALVIEYLGVKVRSIALDEIDKVQSAFLLSSLRIAQSVLAIEGRGLQQSPDFLREIQAMALRTSVG